MSGRLWRSGDRSIQGRLNRLILQMFIPVLAILICIVLMLVVRNYQYASVSGNIIDASGFNQNFKDEVDLKMYQFVSGSSDQLPWDEVRTAQELAEKLLGSTQNSESHKAIENVLYLCDSLETSITKIQETERYDQRMEQLETNIYVITQLIQEHIYTYLYHEAGEMAQLQRQLDIWLMVEIVAAVLVLAIVIPFSLRNALRIRKSITDPIDALSSRVEEIGQGDLTPRTPVEAEDDKLRTLSRGIEEMTGRLSNQIELNRQEQIRLRGIELSLIQAQINPHFLYNTLDAIVWLIETGKNQEAEQMVTSLSTYFRSFLSNGKDIITLAEEELHVRSYLEIQQVRYRDILSYHIDIDPAIKDCLIPKMTLQPLVENAIYHGLKPRRSMGRLEVLGRMSGGRATLEVKDTGVGMTTEELAALRDRIAAEDGTSFGLLAASKRLKLFFGADCTFSIDSDPERGTVVKIDIPVRREDAHEKMD